MVLAVLSTSELLDEETIVADNTQGNRGFTLIELMVVVLLVAIMAAITVPQLVEVTRRGHLEETVNAVHRAVADARALAMKTRLATVVEIREESVWINQLATEACTSGYRKRCVQVMGATAIAADENVLRWDQGAVDKAGVAMCSFRQAAVNATGVCAVSNLSLGDGGAVCFNGSGQLWVRSGGDDTTLCAATDAAQDPTTVWLKSCVPWAANPGGATAQNAFSGADVRFNRFESGAGTCPPGGTLSADAKDVTRQVLIPAGGHPLVRLP